MVDKDFYVFVTGTAPGGGASFWASALPIPIPIPDNSLVAFITSICLLCALGIIFVIKLWENIEYHINQKDKITAQNILFQNRLGIDFDSDRMRLKALANVQRNKFKTFCLKYKNLANN